MNLEKKISLEKKLHHNFIDIIDEFNEDYGLNITEVEYKVTILKSNKQDNVSCDDITFSIKTDIK
jgi:hypothetical protein